MNRREFIKYSAVTLLIPSVYVPVAYGNTLLGNPKLSIGMNLSEIADWETGFPFRNLMWGARLWLTHDTKGYAGEWNTNVIEHIPLDANGYPLELPVSVPGQSQPQCVFTLLPNVRTPGKYVLLYEGEGEFDSVSDTTIISKTPGRLLLEMKQSKGDPNNAHKNYEGISITQSVRGNHVRNIRIVPLADEHVDLNKDPYLPEFIDFCRPFHALRFMDWMHTNDSLESEWKNRKKTTFYTMVGSGGDLEKLYGKHEGVAPSKFLLSGGVAIEICIDLCNRLGVNAWFNVPHQATDDYIEQFARLVKDKLDPRLKVYCEFSNELWNDQFLQSDWLKTSKYAVPAHKEGAFGSSIVDKLKHTHPDDHAERAGAVFRRCFAIWEKVFSGSDRSRLVRVCAVQLAWTESSEKTLKYCMENGGVDALAPSGYFGPGKIEYKHWRERGASLTADEVIADLNTAFERDTAKWTRDTAVLARNYNVSYVTYEGGQHVQPERQEELPYMPSLASAQKHAGMYDLYIRNFRLLQEIECKLFCAYTSITEQGSRWGSFGHAARYKQPLSETPKLRALLDSNIARPR